MGKPFFKPICRFHNDSPLIVVPLILPIRLVLVLTGISQIAEKRKRHTEMCRFVMSMFDNTNMHTCLFFFCYIDIFSCYIHIVGSW